MVERKQELSFFFFPQAGMHTSEPAVYRNGLTSQNGLLCTVAAMVFLSKQ